MIKVIYDPVDGAATPDGRALEQARNWVSCGNLEVRTSSFLVIDWLRVAVTQKKILNTQLEIYFQLSNGSLQKIDCNENGRLSPWPSGFGDYISKALANVDTGKKDSWFYIEF